MRCNWPWTAIAILAFSPQAGLAQTSVDRALIGVLEEVPCVYAGEASHFACASPSNMRPAVGVRCPTTAAILLASLP